MAAARACHLPYYSVEHRQPTPENKSKCHHSGALAKDSWDQEDQGEEGRSRLWGQ